jgi:hypothetical protein
LLPTPSLAISIAQEGSAICAQVGRIVQCAERLDRGILGLAAGQRRKNGIEVIALLDRRLDIGVAVPSLDFLSVRSALGARASRGPSSACRARKASSAA